MNYLLTAQEMRRYDDHTSTALKIPPIVLMERAALGATEHILTYISDSGKEDARVLVLCGTGNNGGDGLALARMLFQKKINVKAFLIGDAKKASELNKQEQDALFAYGTDFALFSPGECAEKRIIGKEKPDIIVDALFGIGLSRPLGDEYADLASQINDSGSYIFSLDIPSGVYTDGGGYGCSAVRANETLTFGFLKVGLMVYPGAEYAGKVTVIDMGIDEFSMCGDAPVYRCMDSGTDVSWPRRIASANKGTYGKLLVIAGSSEVYGAAFMAASSAFAMGAGMVKIITHENNREALCVALPEAMYSFYGDGTTEDEIGDILSSGFSWADLILIGPGIGLDDKARSMVRSVILDTDLPVVIDADAVRITGEGLRNGMFSSPLCRPDERNMVFTPHLKEMSYLTGIDVSAIKEDILTVTKKWADSLGITLICKDARSVIASASREHVYVNISGNDGMATAGSGDVLAGMCAVMCMQTGDVYEGAAGAAFLHGISGDDAAKRKGREGMTAVDIIDSIGTVIKQK